MKKILTLGLLAVLTVSAYAQRPLPEKLYGFKSAILKTVTTTGEAKSYDTRWIDDYGQKEKSRTTMDMGEIGMYEAIILMLGEDCWAINADGEAKKMNARPIIDWYNLTNEDYKLFDVKDKGTEEYKGKTCHVYSYKQKQLLTKVDMTVWVWEGLVIRQHIKKKLSESWVELESLQVNVPIPAGTFTKPEKWEE